MKKILIVKIGAIGDIIMALPLLTFFKKGGDSVQITWVTGTSGASLLSASKLVDHLITIDEKKLLTGTFWEKALEIGKIWKHTGGRVFDLILTAHVDPRYRILSLAAWGKKRRSFHKIFKRPSLIPGRYHRDEYLRLASNLDGPDLKPFSFPLLHTPLITGKKKATSNKDRPPQIALAPGGAKNVLADDFLRRWPIEHYVILAEKIHKKGYRLLLTGSESDLWILPYFEKIPCENRVGKTSLLQLIDLYRRCDLLITHDSGSLHLAKLAECPVIALFGPTNPWEKVAPRQEKISVIWGGEELPCRPCYDGKKYALCQNNLCLKGITPDSIFRHMDNLVAQLRG